MKTRSPQPTGLECASPGIGVFHRVLVDCHLVGSGRSSAIPLAFGPRKEGQFSADAETTKVKKRTGRNKFLNRPTLIVETFLPGFLRSEAKPRAIAVSTYNLRIKVTSGCIET